MRRLPEVMAPGHLSQVVRFPDGQQGRGHECGARKGNRIQTDSGTKFAAKGCSVEKVDVLSGGV